MSNPPSNAVDYLLAAGKSDAPALHCDCRSMTYAALRENVAGLASLLLQNGVAKGDRVAVLAENCRFFVAAYLAAMRAGCCAVPIPTDMNEERFNEIVENLGPHAVFASSRLRRRIESVVSRCNLIIIDDATALPAADYFATAWPAVDPACDLAAVMLTSGSTGSPKGVMVSHRNIIVNSQDIVEYLALNDSDRAMAVLPFYYCYGASVLHSHLAVGASVVINNRFMFPEKVLDELASARCTGFAGVPSTYQILLRKTRFTSRQFPDLRWLQQAGGKLPNPFICELLEAFPQVKLFVMYGQTEATARLSYLPPDRLDDKLGSVGKGLPHSKLEVINADGRPVSPGSDEIGEIVASGDNVTLGYWNDPAESIKYFRDGKLYTGDMARLDSDGFIFIVERARDFIKALGNRVSPKEIEEAISEIPEVVEAAVIGVPHEIWGEAIKAFVVPVKKDAVTAEKIRAHCLARLPNYKIPEYVEIVSQLPRTSAGKISKEKLRQIEAAKLAN